MLFLGLSMFAEITTALVNGGNFTDIPQAVRDYYSKEVLHQAQPRCKFLQFAKVKRDLTAIKGKQIVFTKFFNISNGGPLTEDQKLNPVPLSTSEIDIPVTEQGNAVTVTEFLIQTSLFDILGETSKVLANDVAITLDKQFIATCLTTSNVVYANGKTSPADFNNTDEFNTKTVKDAVQILQTNNTPRFQGDYYVCMAHPAQLRQLRDDDRWINANTYMGRRQLYVGEVGMYEGVIFIDSTNLPLQNTADVVADGYAGFAQLYGAQAVMFGENAYAWAVALDIELRDDGIQNFGRFRSLAWYGIWGTGIIEGLNVVKILSPLQTEA